MNKLKKIVKGNLLENEPMSKHTSYGIGGPASAYITPYDRKDLAQILQFAHKNKLPIYFIGSGSNLLVADQGINGIVVSPARSLKKLEIDGNSIRAESGVMLGRLVKECMKNNLSGLETLVGVPGTLGGALVMNAGAFGGEISNYLQSVEIMKMNGSTKTYKTKDINFSYRFSSFKQDEFIILANFILPNEDPNIIKQKKNIASSGRKTNQPLKFRSAGSVFKNPENFAAGYLIDKVGLKGKKIGGAEISTHHANFFINHGNASAEDITKLIKLAKKAVFEKFNIELELEIKTIGIESKYLNTYD
tara:strand:- start:1041 stop:1955 length:915 start_codon:yes stop_codon:yes gene_type:complete